MSQSLINQSHLIANIDRLVRDVIFHHVSFENVKTRLNGLYYPFMYNFDADLFYSQTIDAFVYSTNAIVGDAYPSGVLWDDDKTQQFIHTLADYKNIIELEDSAWHSQETQNKSNLEGYIRNLTKHYARLLFVRVDLKYSQESSHLVTIEDFNLHMNKFREFIGNKKTCFEHLQGYAWALEQGVKNGGLHCHLLLIYDGSERQNDWYLADEVGKKWLAITEDLGYAHNCSNSKSKKRHQLNGTLGIDIIHRDNPQQVANAINTALYLTRLDKVGQRLKVWLPSMRTFGHGIYRTGKRRGLAPIAN